MSAAQRRRPGYQVLGKWDVDETMELNPMWKEAEQESG